MIKTTQVLCIGILTALVGCASVDSADDSDARREVMRMEPSRAEVRSSTTTSEPSESASSTVVETPETLRFATVPAIREGAGRSGEPEVAFPPFPDGDVTVSVSASQSILEFIDVIYGDILGTGYTLGPGVEANPGIVNFRSPPEMSPRELYESAARTLGLHAISVIYEDGDVQIIENAQLRQAVPNFIPSRARRSVPAGLQPVVQFVEIYARDLNEMANSLQRAFPDRDQLAVEVNRSSNSLILAGLPNDVSIAMDIIRQLDELRFAESTYAVYRAQNWNVEDLTQALESLLKLNGYSVATQSGVTASVNLLPVPFTQQVYIFAREPKFLDYAVNLIRMLDQDAAPQNALKTRVYKAKHYKAEELVTILERVSQLGGGAATPLPQATNASARPQGPDNSGGLAGYQSFVVDEQGNRIIFEATNEEYADLLKLLRQIDVPASEVLIEVTIAEVTLTDDRQSGVELLFQQIGSRGFAVGLGTQGLGLGDGGLAGSFQSGDYIVDFSALATNNQVNVLSTPRIVTKSGSDANIQVGTEVPIILSQSAGASQSGGTTDILQSVQYRQTGIILNITPLVLSGDRIDLSITQEVSAAEANANQAIASPIISNRSLQTELTLQDGQSAILGGLIENRYTRGTSGVPVLKDIPIVGSAFNTETLNSTQTVLMVMITPYILQSRSDRAQVVDELSDIVNEAFLNQVEDSKTLRKPKSPMRVKPSHAEQSLEE